jgi:predicted Zn-dependent protease
MRPVSLALFCLTLNAQNLSPDREAALGRQMAEAVRRSTTPVESREVQDYVAQLGSSMAAGFTFEVVSTDESNALHQPVALPGGYIFVPTSLLLAASDEAEFAGMLAQAMSRQPFHGPISGGIAPMYWSDSFSGNLLLPVAAIEQRRAIDLKADTAAVLTMSRAGFDPGALLRYIERMQPQDGPRLASLRNAIRDIPPAVERASDDFNTIQAQVRPAPAKPRTPPSLFNK